MPKISKWQRKSLSIWKKRAKRFGRKRMSTQSISIVRPVGVPDKLLVKLPWTHVTSFAAAVSALQVYRANSLFDPDFTGVGTQPNYFDQYSALYNKYRVLAVSVTGSVGFGGAIGGMVCTGFTDVDPTGQNFVNNSARTYSKNHGLYPGLAQGGNQLYLNDYMVMKKIHGKPSIEQEEDTGALTSTNPADPAYYYVQGLSEDGVTQMVMVVTLKFIFYAEFYERVNVNQS